jgi:hypothetical protein
MNINARKEELAQEYMREHPNHVFQGAAPGSPEWEAYIYQTAGLIACNEAAVVEDASHLYHCPNSDAELIRTAQPDRYQAIVDRVAQRGY